MYLRNRKCNRCNKQDHTVILVALQEKSKKHNVPMLIIDLNSLDLFSPSEQIC